MGMRRVETTPISFEVSAFGAPAARATAKARRSAFTCASNDDTTEVVTSPAIVALFDVTVVRGSGCGLVAADEKPAGITRAAASSPLIISVPASLVEVSFWTVMTFLNWGASRALDRKSTRLN